MNFTVQFHGVGETQIGQREIYRAIGGLRLSEEIYLTEGSSSILSTLKPRFYKILYKFVRHTARPTPDLGTHT